ncbi:uncharacterized protein si:ch211-140m22.7 isoform X3 [Ctenopharyngodon idella]|uniref:uncharacterized protein si:ch211-140m22.7 isoform X3 n=1 Tax=Ctenopharyngodon idella TaxID=7959 RepID=UPI00222FAA27|nr:uncharacterized protein si:ch211-140m22.7 isoform X3 [Ctenopharyngodon idella]
MATSLLRLGRLGSVKCLLREGWTPRTPFVAALCTKGDVTPKTAKKSKASTIEADERASLLAYKPAVAFPSKLSATGFLLKDVALGESETAEVVSTAAASETTTDSPVADTAAADIAVEEAKITEVPPTDGATTESEGSKTSDVKAEVQKDQDVTSSSSSSDSDSDSDSDDEKPKTETPVQSGDKAAEEKKAPSLTIEEVGVPDKEATSETASFEEAQESNETVTKATPEEVPVPSAKPVGSAETLIDPAPVISSTTEAIPEVSGESITVATPDKIVDTATEIKTAPTEEIAVEKELEIKVEEEPEIKVEDKPEIKVEDKPEIKVEEAAKVSAEVVPKVTTEAGSEEVADTAFESSPEASPEAPGDVAAPKAEAGTLAAVSEELVDTAPVTADAVEALAETDVVETPEEKAPEKAPEPEPEPEPFDNTTYKNLQHHHYNTYTFADMDVEMSKHRLPQPSAGRH